MVFYQWWKLTSCHYCFLLGEKDAQGEIKEGLDGVAEKLSKHVETLKAQMEEQTGQYEALLEEHETLTEQLEQEKAKNDMLGKELDDNEQRAKLLEQDMKSAKGAEEKVLKLLEKLGGNSCTILLC